ncbi:MAG TPA: RDD family protein [Elusimicrobiota bacterium]|jgi:class 3 adenylate cyclase/uncharacterized RDD family membrane protein YckC|nr:RDD family protein [Elusimicrobiota bacterium]
MEHPKTSHLTVLLTDIKGFTDKTSRKSRAEILAMLEKHKELVLPVLTGRGGRLVKTIGDAFLMTFESPTDAVLAGVAVQDALRGYNSGRAADDRIDVRVAINSGEVTLADNDIFGDPVNITARIEGVAEAGEVFFTEAVYLAMNKNEVPSSEIGLLQLKGIPEKIRVYKVKREHPVEERSAAEGAPVFSPAQAPRPAAGALPSSAAAAIPSARPSFWRRAGALLFDLILCGMIAGFIWPSHRKVVAAHWHFALIWFVYLIVFFKRWDSTPGGCIFKLAVVRKDGKPMTRHERFARAAASLLSLYFLMLGFLWALWEKDGRGWHDLIAGTQVVDAEACPTSARPA